MHFPVHVKDVLVLLSLYQDVTACQTSEQRQLKVQVLISYHYINAASRRNMQLTQ